MHVCRWQAVVRLVTARTVSQCKWSRARPSEQRLLRQPRQTAIRSSPCPRTLSTLQDQSLLCCPWCSNFQRSGGTCEQLLGSNCRGCLSEAMTRLGTPLCRPSCQPAVRNLAAALLLHAVQRSCSGRDRNSCRRPDAYSQPECGMWLMAMAHTVLIFPSRWPC